MTKNLIVLLLTHFMLQISSVDAAVNSTDGLIEPAILKKELVYSKTLSVKDVEDFLGRKMTFFEKVGFKIKKKAFVKILNDQAKIQAEESKSTNGMAIAGFVCGILLPPLGIIFSGIGLGQIKKRGEKGKGFAVAGLIIGIVLTVLLLV